MSTSTLRATNVASHHPTQRAERTSTEPYGVLRPLADRAGGRCYAFGEAVDLVVEHDDLEVDVAADHMQEVIAADRQRIAVAGDDPDLQIRTRQLQSGGDGRGTAVNAVEAVGVHVVREPAGAADAGDEHRVLRTDAEVGHHELERGEHRVVTATGTPPDLLVGREVLLRQRDRLRH
jgi:hypothetical protein